MFDFLEIEKPINKIMLGRIHPVTKLFFLIIIYILVFKYSNLVINILLLIFLIFLTFINKTDLKYLKSFLKISGYLYLFYSIFILVFIDGQTIIFNAYIFTLSKETISVLINMFFRVFTISLATVLFVIFTGITNVVYAIEDVLSPLKKLKVPVKVVTTILLLAFHFIPIMVDEINKISKAQEVRGINVHSKNIFKRLIFIRSIIIPLLISIFKRAEELSQAMTMRNYDPFGESTRLSYHKNTIFFRVINVILFLIIFSIIII